MKSNSDIVIGEAREILDHLFSFRTEHEKIPILSAIDRVAASRVDATHDSPPYPRSAMDGYAVRSTDISRVDGGGRVTLELQGEIVIGTAPRRYSGTGICVRIPTGGSIPDPFDTVVPVEYASEQEGRVEILKSFPRGSNIDQRGTYHSKGSTILEKGKIISSGDVAVLSSEGLMEVEVVKRLSVGVLATGNELVPIGDSGNEESTYNSNTQGIRTMLEETGNFQVTDYGIARDEPELLKETIKKIASENMIVITTGGTSAGRHDYVPEAISQAIGRKAAFHGIRMKPGAPSLFSTDGTHFAIGLPGTPVSSYLVMRELFLPVIMEKIGAKNASISWVVELAKDARISRGKFNIVPVRINWEEDHPRAYPVQGSSSSLIRISASNGYFTSDGDTASIPEGSRIRVKPLRWVSF